jgi:hypothetical protein
MGGQAGKGMTQDTDAKRPKRPRSANPDYVPPDMFASVEEELRYYKQEYQRLKAIIALQKQKIRKLLA